MEVSGQFCAMANLPTRKWLLLCIKQGVMWAPEPAWML